MIFRYFSIKLIISLFIDTSEFGFKFLNFLMISSISCLRFASKRNLCIDLFFTFLIKEIESKSAVPTGEHSQESQHNPEDESQEIPFDDDNQQSSDDSDDSAAFNIFTI